MAILLCQNVFAQGEPNIWYFGNHMGYDFNVAQPPGILFDGTLETNEGTSAICDPQGKLLFYSNGVQVWDRRHQRMPNGFDLFGHRSSSQSALIIPKPGNSDLFYLFTTDAGYYDFNGGDEVPGGEGLRYSEVSICENGGLGDVISFTKNKLLVKPVPEKLCAVYHQNGTDVWVVTHGYNSNEFYAYLVTDHGVQESPVISEAGPIYPGSLTDNAGSALGQMMFSADGKRIALTIGTGVIESISVYDFNNETGEITNPILMGIRNPYGIEFSPDATKLYVTSTEFYNLVQYDLTAGTEAQINGSYKLIYHNVGTTRAMSSMVHAPDGKIYTNWQLVIKKPNEPGKSCELDSLAVTYTLTKGPGHGLTNFNKSYVDPNPFIVDYKSCDAGRFDFKIVHEDSVESVVWSFDDVTSGTANTSAEKMPTYFFSDKGVYSVKATMILKSGRTLIKNKKVVWKDFKVNLGPDTSYCDLPARVLDARQPDHACYLWQDGKTSSTNVASHTGLYWVEVRFGGCTKRDSVFLTFEKTPNIVIPDSAILCQDGAVLIDARADRALNRWSDGFVDPLRVFRDRGLFWVETYRNKCIDRDSVFIHYQEKPKLNLPADTTLCYDKFITLDVSQPGGTYTWSDGETTGTKQITEEGEYWVEGILNTCKERDTVNVVRLTFPSPISMDTLICNDTKIILDVEKPVSVYNWSTGSLEHAIEVSSPGLYSVEVSNHCYTVTQNFMIRTEYCGCDIFVPNVFTPGNNDLKNDFFYPIAHQRITDLSLKIIDRWGGEVVNLTSLDEQWNGNLKSGVEASSGVYYFIIEYGCLQANTTLRKKKKGFVHLIR